MTMDITALVVAPPARATVIEQVDPVVRSM
ncbi:hypothetical protein FHR80_000199 [Cellulomonas cellasea]|uniref:Uncharacterized protein n=1 Tax=Cellulomonas cellasea TaxID=43670 RepID=A0A7W4UCT8_9CELL|nr:hypothetical protein [Cellulomonas cellasea]